MLFLIKVIRSGESFIRNFILFLEISGKHFQLNSQAREQQKRHNDGPTVLTRCPRRTASHNFSHLSASLIRHLLKIRSKLSQISPSFIANTLHSHHHAEVQMPARLEVIFHDLYFDGPRVTYVCTA